MGAAGWLPMATVNQHRSRALHITHMPRHASPTRWRLRYYLSHMATNRDLPPGMDLADCPWGHLGFDIAYAMAVNQTEPLGNYTWQGSLHWNPPFDGGGANAEGLDTNNHQGMVEFPEGSSQCVVRLLVNVTHLSLATERPRKIRCFEQVLGGLASAWLTSAWPLTVSLWP